jgi:hypothetical protein
VINFIIFIIGGFKFTAKRSKSFFMGITESEITEFACRKYVSSLPVNSLKFPIAWITFAIKIKLRFASSVGG